MATNHGIAHSRPTWRAAWFIPSQCCACSWACLKSPNRVATKPPVVSKWQLLRLIERAARKFGRTMLANAANLSRKQLARVIGRQVESRPTTIRLLLQAIVNLEIQEPTQAQSVAQFLTFHHNL